ncbi:MAG: NAD(P)-dependent glycerol-3-phosphate dehydrogenase [Candidatus Aminicenantes bacterium]|nr:NAD(P)-dependent glycerol-3-phosphate dehydrogenase [Candidatus Aminicenantes bacterium]
MRAAVIGGGSWGSAFARYLGRMKVQTTLWIREEEVLQEAAESRENKTFLPGFVFPPSVSFTGRLEEAVSDAEVVFVAVPSAFCRPVYERMAAFLRPAQSVISLTKGLEAGSLMRMTDVMAEVFPASRRRRLGALSGPSFAREVAARHPTALVLASRHLEWARRIQHRLSSPTMRIYTSRDIVGVELAGALKNVIAIAAGICDGLDFGLNSRAALITRGLAEMTKLGRSLGARPETFFGLAGLGDLVLTCTGGLSRNRWVGVEVARGRSLSAITSGTTMVAEGVLTTLSVRGLSRRQGVEMPISREVDRILYYRKNPRQALAELMSRALRNE